MSWGPGESVTLSSQAELVKAISMAADGKLTDEEMAEALRRLQQTAEQAHRLRMDCAAAVAAMSELKGLTSLSARPYAETTLAVIAELKKLRRLHGKKSVVISVLCTPKTVGSGGRAILGPSCTAR
jgi:hypothetical protein